MWYVNLCSIRFLFHAVVSITIYGEKEYHNIISFNDFTLLMAIYNLYSIQQKYKYILNKWFEFQYNVLHVYLEKKNQVHWVSICSVSRIIDNHKFRSMMPLVSSYCNTFSSHEICNNILQINVNKSKLFSISSPLLSSYFSLLTSVNLAFPRLVNDISYL